MSEEIKIITLETFLKREAKKNQGIATEKCILTCENIEELKQIRFPYAEIVGVLYKHSPATTINFSGLEQGSSLEKSVKSCLTTRKYRAFLFLNTNEIKVITYKRKSEFQSLSIQDKDGRGWENFYLKTLAQVFGPKQ